jgi:hypothetical protein
VAVATRSPYTRLPERRWLAKTEELLAAYPADREELVEIVLEQWASIFDSRIGTHGLRIGEHIFPKPQIMGDYLHELIPYELQARYPERWRRDHTGFDKDLVNLEDEFYSTEIKTSSNASGIFGNRSYAQPGPKTKKAKSGFFLTVNFEKWSDVTTPTLPQVRIIRLGWLDHTDWKGQDSPRGQASSILRPAYGTKLIELYRR